MLLPELLNSNNVLLFLAGLHKDKDHAFETLKIEILTRSTSALLHFSQINKTSMACVHEFSLFENQLNLKDNKIVYTSMALGFLLNEISPLLSTLRMLQNLILKLISNFERVSLPSSINDYMRKQKKYKVSDNTAQIISNYWFSTGLKLKQYRDIDQHFSALTERYFMQIKPDNKILIQFPDNPEVKSLKKFTYNDNVDGIAFLQNAFSDIVNTFDKLAEMYGAKQEQHKTSISLAQLGDLMPATDRTLSFSYENNISNTDGKFTMNISGWGMEQLPNMNISVRKYYLDSENLGKAGKIYQAVVDESNT